MKQHWHVVCILVGILLMMASAVWPLAADGRSRWTPDKAARFEEIGAGLHELSHARAHASPSHHHDEQEHEHDASRELAAAQRAYQQLARELDAVRAGPQRTAGWLRWTGIGIAAVGSLGYWARREAVANR